MTHWDGSFYHAIAHHLPNPIVVAELDGRIVFANPEVERLAGRALVDLHIDDLVEPEQSGLVAAWFESMSVGVAGRSVYLGALPVTWDGVDRWIEMSGREILAVDGFRGVVVALRDVTEHQQQLEALEYHLGHDELTGLINRSALQQHLALLAAGPDTSVVMFLDLDNFKLINDAYGHHVGDELLIAFAARLRSAVPDAVVGRQGGDEFLVSVPATGLEQGVELARQVSGLLAEPYRLAGGRVTCTASIGVAVLDRSVEDSLREADVALYRAKRDGRNQVAPYDDETRTWADRRWDIEVEVAALKEELEETRRQAMAHRIDARTDDGTGLPNRRRLFEDLDAVHAESRASRRPYGVAFLDLDHFGKLNKFRGDDEGDRILRDVAAVLQATMREGEAVYRKGGEELVVILSGADLDGAKAAGERFRRALEEAALPHGGVAGWPVVTVSVGVAVGPTTMPEETLRVAGLCMLGAKAAGRNRVSSTPLRLPAESF